MISREDIFEYVKIKYGTIPDYPWAITPHSAILRHDVSRKWYAAIIKISKSKLGLIGQEEIDALLLKNDPLLIDHIVGQPGIFRGYHMNKKHWITVVLESDITKEDVLGLIDESFQITSKKIK